MKRYDSYFNKRRRVTILGLAFTSITNESRCICNHLRRSATKEKPLEEIKRNLSSNTSYTFGAFQNDNQLVGVVTLLLEQKAVYKHKGHLVAMYVDHRSRGRGIAKALIEALIEKAKGIDIEQIHLGVVSDNNAKKETVSIYRL